MLKRRTVVSEIQERLFEKEGGLDLRKEEEEDWEEVPEHRVLPHGWIPERIHLLFRLCHLCHCYCRLLSPFVLFDFHEA